MKKFTFAKKYRKIFFVLLTSLQLVFTNNIIAQPFVTEWDLSISGSGSNFISFGVETSNGIVEYNWATIPNVTATGSGYFEGFTGLISDLPVGSKISLSITSNNFKRFNMLFSYDNKRLTNVSQWGNVIWRDMRFMFYRCSNMNITATDVPDMTNVTNMSDMFAYATSFNSPIGNWNTSNVSDMSYMFREAISFNQPIGNWNTFKVYNMSFMFEGAKSFNQPIGNWNTYSVEDMSVMFSRATNFDQPIGNWNTHNVKNMDAMFYGARFFNQPIGNWNTTKVTKMGLMFAEANSFNQPIGNWDISNTTTFGFMFSYATSFNQNLGAWGSKFNSKVGFGRIFENCGMSVANYDATLQGFSATTVTGKNMIATGLKYCLGAAARNILTSSTVTGGKGWTIQDGGLAAQSFIIIQPSSQNKCIGDNADFLVSAVGSDLNYTWSNGLSTSNIMTTSVVGNNYNVTVTGACSLPVISNTVSLNTITGSSTKIITQPISQTICGGNLANFSVSASGDNLSYLWNTNSTTTSINTSITGNYLVTVSGTCGNAVSNTVSLNILSGTKIVTQPISQTLCGGNLANFSVSASGDNLSYLWNTNETATSINTSITGNYLVTVSGTCGNAISNSASLNTILGTKIITQPTSQTMCGGNLANFSVSASGNNLTYLWNTNATTTSINTSFTGNYLVTVSGTCGNALSNTASLNTILGTKIRLCSNIYNI